MIVRDWLLCISSSLNVTFIEQIQKWLVPVAGDLESSCLHFTLPSFTSRLHGDLSLGHGQEIISRTAIEDQEKIGTLDS